MRAELASWPYRQAKFGLTEPRVALERYQGRERCDIRTWANRSVGALAGRGPTRIGLFLAVSDLPALAAAIHKAEAKAREIGLIGEEGDRAR